MEDPLAYE
jgi:colicin import membrane protein